MDRINDNSGTDNQDEETENEIYMSTEDVENGNTEYDTEPHHISAL